jgi:uncharacterized membrane protein (UPF0127 family)
MNRRWLRFAAVPLVLLVLLASLEAAAFQRESLSIETAAGQTHTFTVEVARSDSEKSRGLMFRRSLSPDAGMLFDWPDRPVATMWMKNTLIPLDMMFIDRQGRIVYIAERTVPHSLEHVSAGRRVRAVLELRGGAAGKLSIAVGDRVIHPIFDAP